MSGIPAPDDRELLERYVRNYGLDSAPPNGVDDVRFHFDLETRLTQELLASTAEDRWDVFNRAYSELYEKLPWLSQSGGTPDPERWERLIGPAPRRVYEVGSGAGGLARALAEHGYTVVATDISRERGDDRLGGPRLIWGVTDGVHLERHADAGSFDAVLSDQVIEHLHPDDVTRHFAGALALLRPAGRYVFRTPHALTGPHDVSLVFGFDRPVGMHLREYTCDELVSAAQLAGFGRVRSVVSLPRIARATWPSTIHRRYEGFFDKATGELARKASRRLRGSLRPAVWLVAERAL
jgi:SAM-dependent methyltransferase